MRALLASVLFASFFLLRCVSAEEVRLPIHQTSCVLPDNTFQAWPIERVVQESLRFDELSTHHIWLSVKAGDLVSKYPYLAKEGAVNFDALYRLVSEKGVWDFRFGGYGYNTDGSGRTLLYNVEWAGGKIPATDDVYRLEVVRAPNVPQKGEGLTMIGDSITWWERGEKFRCLLRDAGYSGSFIGSHTDIYGLKHEGEGGDLTTDVLARIGEIPVSSAYFVLIGTNDHIDHIAPHATADNIIKIAHKLKRTHRQSMVYISTLLPRDDEWGKRNAETNKILRRIVTDCGERCKLIDLEAEFLARADWRKLLADHLHPNEDGYVFMAKILARQIDLDQAN